MALLAQAGIKVDDTSSEETAKRIQEIALETDEHFRVDSNKRKAVSSSRYWPR